MADPTLPPLAGGYMEQLRLRQKAYEQAKARLTHQSQSLFTSTGFTGTYNQGTGHFDNVGVDPNNPTGGYQQLRHGEVGQLEGLEEQQAQTGFTGGLAGRARNQMRYQHGVQDSGFMRSLMDSLGGVEDSYQENETSWNQDHASILNDFTTAAAGDPANFTPAAPSGPLPTAGGAAKAFQWGGKTWNLNTPGQKAAFMKWMRAHGGNYDTWAKTHAVSASLK